MKITKNELQFMRSRVLNQLDVGCPDLYFSKKIGDYEFTFSNCKDLNVGTNWIWALRVDDVRSGNSETRFFDGAFCDLIGDEICEALNCDLRLAIVGTWSKLESTELADEIVSELYAGIYAALKDVEIDAPDEIYNRALELEGFNRWPEGRELEGWQYETGKRGWTDGGLEDAIKEWAFTSKR